MCIVYTATSSSTVVQDLHTALGWIACTDVRRGFCMRVLHSLCSKAFIHIHKYTSVVNIPNAAILPLWLGRCLITQSLPTGHPFPSSKWSSFTTVVESSLGQRTRTQVSIATCSFSTQCSKFLGTALLHKVYSAHTYL